MLPLINLQFSIIHNTNFLLGYVTVSYIISSYYRDSEKLLTVFVCLDLNRIFLYLLFCKTICLVLSENRDGLSD